MRGDVRVLIPASRAGRAAHELLPAGLTLSNRSGALPRLGDDDAVSVSTVTSVRFHFPNPLS